MHGQLAHFLLYRGVRPFLWQRSITLVVHVQGGDGFPGLKAGCDFAVLGLIERTVSHSPVSLPAAKPLTLQREENAGRTEVPKTAFSLSATNSAGPSQNLHRSKKGATLTSSMSSNVPLHVPPHPPSSHTGASSR